MQRYAERECDDCGLILPANQLAKIDERVPISHISRSRLYGGRMRREESTRYRLVTINICSVCMEQREQHESYLRRKALFTAVFSLVAILLFTALGYFFLSSQTTVAASSGPSSNVVGDNIVVDADMTDTENGEGNSNANILSNASTSIPEIKPEGDHRYRSSAAIQNLLEGFDQCTDQSIVRGERYSYDLCVHIIADAKEYSDKNGLDFNPSKQDIMNVVRQKIISRFGPDGLGEARQDDNGSPPSDTILPHPDGQLMPIEDVVHRRARAQGWCDGGFDPDTGDIKWQRC